MRRLKYMISWTYQGTTGREFWKMERRGKLSSADVKRLEIDLGKKWGMPQPVIITNYVQVN